MADKIIIHDYPSYKSEITYPKRHTKYTFKKYNQLVNNTELMDIYDKLDKGINYKTNRKIKIKGDTYYKIIANLFMIENIFFKNFEHINQNEYMNETIIIKNKINNENKIIEKYNNVLPHIHNKIDNLKKWNDFIEFEGNKYGMPHIVNNNIHYDNDCFGTMIFSEQIERECKGCRDGIMFNGNYKCNCFLKKIYKCNKCNFMFNDKHNKYCLDVNNNESGNNTTCILFGTTGCLFDSDSD